MTDSGRVQDETLAGQRLRLASLEACEERARALREQECDLEVEHMAATAALHCAAKRLQPDIDPLLAARIGRILEQRREIEAAQNAARGDFASHSTADARHRDRLRAGLAALQAWLDASRPSEPGPVARAAKITLLLATIVSIWAAISIHIAFLLLLLVVVGPVSFAMGRGQDSQWHRAGARRRYEVSGLAPITTWDEQSVRARIAELETMLEKSAANSTPARADGSVESSMDSQAAVSGPAEDDGQLASLLEAAGLSGDDTDGDTGEWLRLVARAQDSRDSLERVRGERARLRAEALELRDHLQRYLQSQGVKPTQQMDSAADIAEQLDDLS